MVLSGGMAAKLMILLAVRSRLNKCPRVAVVVLEKKRIKLLPQRETRENAVCRGAASTSADRERLPSHRPLAAPASPAFVPSFAAMRCCFFFFLYVRLSSLSRKECRSILQQERGQTSVRRRRRCAGSMRRAPALQRGAERTALGRRVSLCSLRCAAAAADPRCVERLLGRGWHTVWPLFSPMLLLPFHFVWFTQALRRLPPATARNCMRRGRAGSGTRVAAAGARTMQSVPSTCTVVVGREGIESGLA